MNIPLFPSTIGVGFRIHYLSEVLKRILWPVFSRWIFEPLFEKIKPKFQATYGVYIEEQFTRRGRQTKAKTIVVIMPKFYIFGFPLGARVIGVHFDTKKIIRDFRSKHIKLRRCEPHIIEYSDLTTQGTDRFPCKGLIWFRSRENGKYHSAKGYVNVPRFSRNRSNVISRVIVKWNRLTETELERFVGKVELRSIDEILELIANAWGIRRS
jgi:hypothetical protein